MTIEINPVLAGTYDKPDYAAATMAASLNNTDDVTGPDDRRYTHFDRTSLEAGTTTMSFGDFLDMVNPLQHIPVVSSIYRAVTGEQIHPVARVAGDILYGGLAGAASAVLGGVSAIADASLESSTGKDSGGLAIATLFGPDDNKDKTVQLADAGTSAATLATDPAAQKTVSKNIEIAQVANPAPASAALAVPDADPAATANADMLMAQASAAAVKDLPVTNNPSAKAVSPAASSAALSPTTSAVTPDALGGISMASAKTNNKQPYGGVMGPTFSNNTQQQDMAIALAQGSPSMRMGHTIYTNPMMAGSHPLPPMLSSGAAAANSPTQPSTAPKFTTVSASATVTPMAADVTATASAQSSMSLPATPKVPLSDALVQDMMLKAISQYKNTASNGGNVGAGLNLAN